MVYQKINFSSVTGCLIATFFCLTNPLNSALADPQHGPIVPGDAGIITPITPFNLVCGAASNGLQDCARSVPYANLSVGLNLQLSGSSVRNADTLGSGFGQLTVNAQNSTSSSGNYVSIFGLMAVNSTPATAGYYSGGWFYAFCNSNQGGTSIFPAGFCVGSNPQSRATTSATYLKGLVGEEVDVEVNTPNAPFAKIGLNVTTIGNDKYQGSGRDMAIAVGSTIGAGPSPGWSYGFALTNYNGQFPLSSGATVVGSDTAGAVAHGIDFSNLTCSSDCFRSPGFLVNGSGAVSSAGLEVTSAAPTVGAGSVAFGGTTAPSSNCGSLAGAAGCLVINVGGATRYVPYY